MKKVPRPSSLILAWALLGLLMGIFAWELRARGQEVAPEAGAPPAPLDARAPTRVLPQSDAVVGIRVFLRNAGRLDWTVQGEAIAFDRRGDDGFYDLYLADSTGGSVRCLTCTLLEFQRAHAFNPAWHPSGRFLVFQVQNAARKLGLDAASMTTPDRGLFNEIWVIERQGKTYWRLVGEGQGSGVLLDPRFSFEGDRLAWSERVRTEGGPWGEWWVRVGRFDASRSVPRLKKVQTHRPKAGGGLVQVSGFSPSEGELLVATGLSTGSPQNLDIQLLGLKEGDTRPLVESRTDWAALARLSPVAPLMAFSSNRGLDPGQRVVSTHRRPSARPVRSELWLASDAGVGRRRLTYFNHPASPHFDTGAVVGDLAWGPEGRRIAIHVVTDLGAAEVPSESIYMVELRPRLGR